jgi:hypothetical protein
VVLDALEKATPDQLAQRADVEGLLAPKQALYINGLKYTA